MSKLACGLCASFIAAASFAAPAAAESMTMKTDQARMLNIAGIAGTVVVGNPNIADVSVRGSQVFVHGKFQGQTNIIVLDRQGVQLASIDVNVETVGGNAAVIFGGGKRYSYNCAPSCEPVLQMGDSYEDYFKNLAQQNTGKTGIATGAVDTTSTEQK